ncbi:methyltransferase domain-containing protein [Shewanella sp. KX20019]|uniref:class I SAM-dependent methyltransferase n=1 Tax=Shewanella sp. KX20019 TaxID=2803864 RepID=UPI0019251A00|nr:class I SAM-dependent methyltransferase [Shewanella sp. KX20019]QQX80977.1 methyltransferase domain-containing protein [Shewanella sp. KX20019]
MDLLEEYERQQTWREWPQYLQYIPVSKGDTVVDLGCSVGDVSALFSTRVKRVIGIDQDQDFINYCRKNKTSNQVFVHSRFETINYDSLGEVNGVWASFSISYLADPLSFLRQLHRVIQPGGWIALLDVACFISANLSVNSAYFDKVSLFELESAKNGGYDFNFGSKIEQILQQAGFEIVYVDNDITDLELNFSGTARKDVVQGWSARLARMQKLSELLGDSYSSFCAELLDNLQSSHHQQRGCVKFVVAKKSSLLQR